MKVQGLYGNVILGELNISHRVWTHKSSRFRLLTRSLVHGNVAQLCL